ncbi:hypothetical protein VI26_11865 [Chromobacterium sp. LK1]|uniref:hypothetical protein n=1 Tax=Chromobacterium sp. LK1 TaxID=1628193 RepID=UPI0006534F0D|nr:hypothetical protein [Chromobacterium sp. LK1]KMN35348.1 hypothetical protein VI26_11865 [Chromobacterium sp. LK1]
MTFPTFPPGIPPPDPDETAAALLEQLRLCLHQLPAAAGDVVALGALGRQLSYCHAKLDALLLQGTIDLRAAHLGLQALLTLLQRRDEPLLFSSEEALALLEPVQQRLQQGLQHINRVF